MKSGNASDRLLHSVKWLPNRQQVRGAAVRHRSDGWLPAARSGPRYKEQCGDKELREKQPVSGNSTCVCAVQHGAVVSEPGMVDVYKESHARYAAG